MIRLFSIPKLGLVNLDQVDHLINGQAVKWFENDFKDYVEYKYAVGTSSCTIAIEVVLNFLLYKEDKRMIDVTIPSIIPPVVPNAVYRAGVNWRWTDNPYWIGGPYTLAETKNYHVVDSAHEVSPTIKYKKEIRLYSFYPTKVVGGIDGGMICTDDEEIACWCRTAVNNGFTQDKNSWSRTQVMPGWKGYMSTAQAIVCRRSFAFINERKVRLSEIRKIYNQTFGLENTSEHLYTIDVTGNRSAAMEKLSDAGIETGIHYSAKHQSSAWGNSELLKLPKSIAKAESTLSIPYHADMKDEEVQCVTENVKILCRKSS